MENLETRVEIKKVDAQGPFILPVDWREVEIGESRELYVIKRSGFLNFDEALCQAKETALSLFSQRKFGYAKHWICSFMCPKMSQCIIGKNMFIIARS